MPSKDESRLPPGEATAPDRAVAPRGAPIRARLIGGAAALGLLAAGAWWWVRTSAPDRPDAAPTAPVATGDRDGAAGPEAAVPEPTTVTEIADLEERRQRDGRAVPGAPLGEGLPVQREGREVGRLFVAAAQSTPLLVLVGDPAAAGADREAMQGVAAAWRRTRDYHLATLAVAAGASDADLEAALLAAIELLPRAPATTVLVAAGRSAAAAAALAARRPTILALALVSPAVAVDGDVPDDAQWSGLRGRQVAIVLAERDAGAAPFVSAMQRLPLGRSVRAASTSSGWPMVAATPRARSDLAGWLFAVTPPAR